MSWFDRLFGHCDPTHDNKVTPIDEEFWIPTDHVVINWTMLDCVSIERVDDVTQIYASILDHSGRVINECESLEFKTSLMEHTRIMKEFKDYLKTKSDENAIS